MARLLTEAELEKIANRKGVRRIAVENFLGTVDVQMGQYAHTRNMYADARAYGWNAATQAAIEAGLKKIYGGTQ